MRTHRVNPENFLSIEFQNHTEYTVSSRVLRTGMQFEQVILERIANTHPKLTICARIRVAEGAKNTTTHR